MKPKYVENLPCPKCASHNTTALVMEDAKLIWCSCGTIYMYSDDTENQWLELKALPNS